jgi:DNA invertase Pin-like site-specific DNA recombinase
MPDIAERIFRDRRDEFRVRSARRNDPVPKPTRAALYARCSTGHQDLGLQVDELRAVARQRGWEVVRVYEDSGVSGTERSRPALDALVADCKAGKVDVVVVWKLDRLARSVVHVCSLAESLASWGVGLVSVRDANVDSTTPSGRFTLAILSAVAELERALIVERVKAGVERARAKGKHLGRPRVALDVRPAVAMMEKGYGLKSVAKALGVPRSTLRRHLADAGVHKGLAAASA